MVFFVPRMSGGRLGMRHQERVGRFGAAASSIGYVGRAWSFFGLVRAVVASMGRSVSAVFRAHCRGSWVTAGFSTCCGLWWWKVMNNLDCSSFWPF